MPPVVPKKFPTGNLLLSVRACRDEVTKLAAGYHRELHERLGISYGIARGFRNDPDAWAEFSKEPFWAGRKKEPSAQDEADATLEFVVHYIWEPTYGFDRAWKYARALKLYLAEGVPTKSIAGKLKSDGGIERVVERATAEQPLRGPTESGSEDDADDEEDGAGGWEDEEAGEPGDADEEDDEAAGWDDDDEEGKRPTLRRKQSPSSTSTLQVKMPDEWLQRLLAMENRKARITIAFVEMRGDFKVFHATKVARLKNKGGNPE